MKFVYHSANKEDLFDLYKRVLNAGLKLPLKPFDATHVSSKLLRPLAVYDYTRYHDPKKVYWPSIEEKEQHQTAMTTTDFHPTITDIDICSSYNTRSVMDVFKQDDVVPLVLKQNGLEGSHSVPRFKTQDKVVTIVIMGIAVFNLVRQGSNLSPFRTCS